jgi:CPA1 family monovalent cation:H+ antiporter
MSDVTREYLGNFWELIDEILNAVLFPLIGFEVLILSFDRTLFWIGCAAIGIVLSGRAVSVSIPTFLLSSWRSFERNTIPVLTWGRLQGGISVALALCIPAHMHCREFVAITNIIVIFSILVQSLTIGRFAKRLTASKTGE